VADGHYCKGNDNLLKLSNSHSTSLQECQAMAETNDNCRKKIFYGHGGKCRCVKIGYECVLTISATDNRVYEAATLLPNEGTDASGFLLVGIAFMVMLFCGIGYIFCRRWSRIEACSHRFVENMSKRRTVKTNDETKDNSAPEIRSSLRASIGVAVRHANEVKESAKALARRSARMESEAAGVSVAYLFGETFKSLACGRTGKSNPNFHHMAASFFRGPQAIGHDVICPRDGKMGCAFIDTLPIQDRKPANVFLSWVWSYSLLIFQEALSLWVEQSHNSVNKDNVFFFVCFFCNNQYRILDESSNGSDDLESVFEARLLSCGKVIALMDDWKKPVYSTRIWTIYEQFVAAKLEVPTQIILPRTASTSLLEQFMRGANGITEVSQALGDVQSKNAVASREADEIKVKGLIESSVGFDVVDDKVVSRLVTCAMQQVQEHLDQNIHEHRVKKSKQSSHTSWLGLF
jgi:hypothetical protein